MTIDYSWPKTGGTLTERLTRIPPSPKTPVDFRDAHRITVVVSALANLGLIGPTPEQDAQTILARLDEIGTWEPRPTRGDLHEETVRHTCCRGRRYHTDDCEHGPTLAETMARLRLRPQAREQIAATVATLTPGCRVRILEDAPGWPLVEVVGRVVELSGTLSLDTWPWPLRLPSGQPGPAVVGIEVLS